MTIPKLFIFAGVLLLFCACAHRAGKWRRAGIIPSKNSFTFSHNPQPKDTLKIVYTGCGGLVIAKGKEAIITDPYYTGHNLVRVLLSKIKVDSANTHGVMRKVADNIIPVKNISTALIAHSHYDHLEDLPYLMEKGILSNSLHIIGSSSTYCTLKPFIKNNYTYLNADTFCFRQNPKNTANRYWDTVSPHIRVLSIEAAHAPHVWKFISLMQGSTCGDGLCGFTSSLSKSKALDWKQGTTFSFLIDILDGNGGVAFRIFLQSSSCAPPYGLPPSELITEKPVDLAILGVASAQNINGYPCDLLNRLNTKKIMLIHWEDFFQNLYKKNPKSVRGTRVTPFLRALKKHYQKNSIRELSEFVKMPKPLSWVTIPY